MLKNKDKIKIFFFLLLEKEEIEELKNKFLIDIIKIYKNLIKFIILLIDL